MQSLMVAALSGAVCLTPHPVARAGPAAPTRAGAQRSGRRREDDDDIPVARLPAPDARGYADLRTAAVAVLRQAVTVSEGKVEYGGAIYQCGQGFFPTEPVSSQEERALHLRMEMPNICHLAGLYHVHPPLEGSSRFSEDDCKSARRYKVPSFVAMMLDGKVRVFDPDRGHLERLPGYSEPTAGGEVVAELEVAT